MLLLLSISSLCFVISFIHYLVKPVIALITAPTREERKLNDEIKQLRAELADISMRHEYTQYVKIERKIVGIQTKLNAIKSQRQTKNLMVQYGLPYGSQCCLILVLVGVTFFYCYTPVIIFDEKLDLAPFSGLIKFPTGVNGAVSVPFWIFVNYFVSSHMLSYL